LQRFGFTAEVVAADRREDAITISFVLLLEEFPGGHVSRTMALGP
jgi:hypothetical protein